MNIKDLKKHLSQHARKYTTTYRVPKASRKNRKYKALTDSIERNRSLKDIEIKENQHIGGYIRLEEIEMHLHREAAISIFTRINRLSSKKSIDKKSMKKYHVKVLIAGGPDIDDKMDSINTDL